jgi:hypothetical protein
MPNWWERKAQRERDLAEGVDADLLSANRRRWALGYKLSAIGALLLATDWLWRLPRWMHLVVASIVFMLMVTAIITWKWARAEQAFLEKPEGTKPLGLLQRQDAGEEENRKTG